MYKRQQSDLARSIEVSSPTIKDYIEIANGSYVWRSLNSFERNVKKQIAKMPKGHIRDSGLLHHLLKIASIEQLETHPILGRSFEGFIVEEILKGLESSNFASWSAHHYRTRAKSEIDLIIDNKFGSIPIEVKYSSKIQTKQLKTIKDFIKDHKSPFGLLANNSDSIEIVGERLYQIPATCL